MPSSLNRRSFVQTGASASLGAFFLQGSVGAAPEAKVINRKIISQQPEFYHGWPTLARRANGELWVTWSGGREAHVCPFGQVHAMTSRDQGNTWTWPRVLLDGAIDDRDSGVLETAKGSLLVTSFSSLAYENTLASANKSKVWPAERLARWNGVNNRLSKEERMKELGEWMLRSTDGGISWSARVPTIVNSPHGPIQLSDGRLIYAGKELWTEKQRVGVCESRDDGQSWQWLAEIPARSGDQGKSYHELHAVEAGNGTLIAHIRNHNKAEAGETLQAESTDGGKTWSEPRSIGVWGLPSHLLRLRDGRLLMTYGHRKAPFGNQARLSEDHGKTWGVPILLSDDGATGDLGYPSTVQLDDQTFLTVWYESMKIYPKAVLRQATWTLA